jgi:hypothetical protein
MSNGSPTIYKSTTIKTLWPAYIATSSKHIQIGAYSTGLTIPRKLSSLIKKEEENIYISNIMEQN